MLPPHIQNIALYIRRSRQDELREKETGEDTLRLQRDLMYQFMTKLNVHYDSFEEIVSGDKISERPQFINLLNGVRKGTFQAISCRDLSRLGRGSYDDMGTVYKLIEDNRVFIVTPDKIYDPSNELDLSMLRFHFFFNREELEMIKRRMRSARYAYAAEGRWMAGAAPFGYELDPKSRKLISKKEEADVVKMIFNLYGKEKIGYNAIATKLNRMGIRTGKGAKWQAMSVRRILTSDTYLGTVKFRTTRRVEKGQVARPDEEHIIVPDAHEPLVTQELFDIVQEELSKNMQRNHTPLDFEACELAGLVKCSSCGKRMIRQSGTGGKHVKKDGSVSNYGFKEFLKCSDCGIYVKYRLVEEQILIILETLKGLEEDRLREELKELLVFEQPEETDNEQIKRNLEKRKGDLEKKRQRVFEAFEEGVYSVEDFNRRKVEIQNELEEIEMGLHELNKVEDSHSIVDKVDVEIIRGNISTIIDTYNKLKHKSKKNELLKAIFNTIELTLVQKGQGRKPAKFDLHYRLETNMLM